MFKLLIIDDEPLITDGLYSMFKNDTELELEVFKTYSSLEAIKVLDERRIDIVLCDIKMPVMDGMQMLDEIKSRWDYCKVIFLTGHDNFNYIYKAIQYNDVKYILKSEGTKVVINKVHEAIKSIETEMKMQQMKNTVEILSASTEYIQKDFIAEILNGFLPAEEVTEDLIKEMGLPLNVEQSLIMVMADIHYNHKVSYYHSMQTFYKIKEITEKYINKEIYFLQVPYESTNIVWFFQLKDHQDSIPRISLDKLFVYVRESIEVIQESCIEAADVILSFAGDSIPVYFQNCQQRFFNLKNILRKLSNIGGEVLWISDNFFDKLALESEDIQLGISEIKTQNASLLCSFIQRGQKQEYYKALDEITEGLIEIKSLNNSIAREIYFSVSLAILSYVNKCNLVTKVAFKTNIYKLTHVDYCKDWKEAVEYLYEISDAIFEIESTESDDLTRTMNSIKKYIEDNIDGDLSLTKLGEVTYFNPSYLSRLFKQTSGCNLSEYILTAKIEKAKMLLKNPNIKIQTVGEKIGYQSPTNFIRLFKKVMGVTPQEYRDLLIRR